MTNRNELERFVAAYNEYCEGEFGNDEITVEEALKENELGVCYTTCGYDEEYGLEDDGLEYQVSYNLQKKTLEYYIDRINVMREEFNSIGEMVDDIKSASFQTYYEIVNDKLYRMLDEGTLMIVDGLAEWNPVTIEIREHYWL